MAVVKVLAVGGAGPSFRCVIFCLQYINKNKSTITSSVEASVESLSDV